MDNTIFDTILRFTKSAPVDVYGLARALGISVVEMYLPEEMSGSIEKKNNKYIISVNKTHPKKRKRFTVAHEIGHFIFHGDLIEQGAIFDDKLYRDDRVGGKNETQANRFAASILMPEKLMSDLISQGFNNLHSLASALEVSEQAMSIRAENLNIIEPQEPINVEG